MARRSHRILAVLAALPALAVVGGASHAENRLPAAPGVVPGELIVGWRAGVPAAQRTRALKGLGVRRTSRLARVRATVVRVAPDRVGSALDRLRRTAGVRYVEPNRLLTVAETFPDDPSFPELWGLENGGQTVNGTAGVPDADVDAPAAWSVTTGSSAVTVGVIDTGVDYDHPDLAANIWVNPGEDCAGCRTDGVDNDGNGYVDDWRGWDFANDDNDPSDDNGHGTHVAGTIGAVGDNGIGAVGLSWSVRVMPLKFLRANGSGTTADAVEAVLYAAANGARVTNNSWSGVGYSQALRDGIAQADAADSLFVAAAGNDARSLEILAAYPAAYDVPNVVAVAATDSSDLRAWFSNYGAKSVDLGAPGVDVYSTWAGGTYRFASGTSMAAPHVAGAAALVAAAVPGASDVGTKALLLATVDPLPSLAGRTVTGGRLNAGSALACSSPQVSLEAPLPGFQLDVGDSVELRAVAARCGDPDAVVVAADGNGERIVLSPRGDGLYTGSYTAGAGGGVSLRVTATAGAETATATVAGAAVETVPIVPGGPSVTVETTAPGQNVRLVFDGVAGRRVSLGFSDVTIGTSNCCAAKVSVSTPAGKSFAPTTYVGAKGGFVDTRTLPETGVYTILVEPQKDGIGSMTLTLYDVPPDATGSLVAGGPPVSTATTVPGQDAVMTFEGVAGARVSLALSDVTIGTSNCCAAKISLATPAGANLGSTTYVGAKGGFVDTRTLPVTGTYTVVVDPQEEAVGGITLTLYDVPPDVTGSLAIGGPALSVSMGTPGQNGSLAFTGAAGQAATLRVTNVAVGTSSCCALKISVTKPDGSTLLKPSYVGRRGGTFALQLPASGAYAVFVDPQGGETGTLTVGL